MILTLDVTHFNTTLNDFTYKKPIIREIIPNDWVLDGHDSSLPFGMNYPIDITPIQQYPEYKTCMDIYIEIEERDIGTEYKVSVIGNPITVTKTSKFLFKIITYSSLSEIKYFILTSFIDREFLTHKRDL